MKLTFGNIERRGDYCYRARFKTGTTWHRRQFSTEADARDWLITQERLLRTDRLEIARAAEEVTFAQALEAYEKQITPTKKSSREEASTLAVIRAYAGEMLQKPLGSILPRDIKRYRDYRLTTPSRQRLRDGREIVKSKPPSPSTVRKDLCAISSIFRFAADAWELDTLVNPVSKHLRPKPARARQRRISDSELQRLLSHARHYAESDAATVPIEIIIQFALATAMRLGEIGSLEWPMVDLSRSIVILADTKNGDSRAVPLSPKALDILKARSGPDSGSVWGCDAESIRTAWNRVVRRAGIRNLRFHDCRHEAISLLIENSDETGLSLAEVMAIAGHRTMAMVPVYYHALAPRLAAKLARGKRGHGTT